VQSLEASPLYGKETRRDEGLYTVYFYLRPGKYRLSVYAAGFKDTFQDFEMTSEGKTLQVPLEANDFWSDFGTVKGVFLPD
jgi:hypothetical protein